MKVLISPVLLVFLFFRVEYTLCDSVCFHYDCGLDRACLVLHLLL